MDSFCPSGAGGSAGCSVVGAFDAAVRDAAGEIVTRARVPAAFKLTSTSARTWIEDSALDTVTRAQPAYKPSATSAKIGGHHRA
jgi:hypothetical protein